jgi:hypothetical protein
MSPAPHINFKWMTTFRITLRSREGDDGIRILRAALKLLLRRFGLQAVSVEEMSGADNDKPTLQPNDTIETPADRSP